MDINPGAPSVEFGDANNLAQFTNGQFDHVIANNPFGYKPLESDMLRVLKPNGRMTVTGNISNKFFKGVYNSTPEQLENFGLEVGSKGNIKDAFLKYGGLQSDGSPIRNIENMLQIVLKKVGKR